MRQTSSKRQGASASCPQWGNKWAKDSSCKRYHKSEPLANPKVSHWPQQSALLERNFKRAEGKKGVSRGTSRRHSHLGLDPGQEPEGSGPPLWPLTQDGRQHAGRGASSRRAALSAPG